MIKYPCRCCGERWIQVWKGEWEGLCRRCALNFGADLPSNKEIEAQRVRQHEQANAERRLPDAGPRPTREIVVDHQVYEVVWDGS